MLDEKRPRLDIGAMREALEKGEISKITWCPGKDQLADCMTKQDGGC